MEQMGKCGARWRRVHDVGKREKIERKKKEETGWHGGSRTATYVQPKHGILGRERDTLQYTVQCMQCGVDRWWGGNLVLFKR